MTHDDQTALIRLVRSWAHGQETPPRRSGTGAHGVWDALRAHDVVGCLGPLVPPADRPAAAAGEITAARRRSELLLLEAARILPGIRAAAGDCVLLKGAALALTAYPSVGDRSFVDLDILVPRDRVTAVCSGLESAGYRGLGHGRDPLFYDKYHLHRILVGPQGSVVEVHWDLTLPRSVYRHDPAGVIQRARSADLAGQTVACAAPVDQVLHASYQHIADGFTDLRRVLDGVLLSRQLSGEDWDLLVRLARKGGLDKALWLSLHIMKFIAGIAVPEDVLMALVPEKPIRRTLAGLDVAGGCLARRAAARNGYVPLLHLLLTPTGRCQFRELGRAVQVGEERLLDLGYPAGALPGAPQRLRLALRQLRTLALAATLAGQAFVRG